MTQNTSPTPGTAAEVYEASMEGPGHENVAARAGRFVAGLATAAFGDDGSAFSGIRVVVRRKDDGSELMTLDGGGYEGDQAMLDAVRADLAELSPAEFVQQWTVAEESQG